MIHMHQVLKLVLQTEEAAHAYTVVQHGWYLTDVSQCGGDPVGDLPDIS